MGFALGVFIGNKLYDEYFGGGGMSGPLPPPNYITSDGVAPWEGVPLNTYGTTYWAAGVGSVGLVLDAPSNFPDALPQLEPLGFGRFRQREFNSVPTSDWWASPVSTLDYPIVGQIIFDDHWEVPGEPLVLLPGDAPQIPSAKLMRMLPVSDWPQDYQEGPGGPKNPIVWLPGNAPAPRGRPLFAPWWPSEHRTYRGWDYDDFDESRLRKTDNYDDRRHLMLAAGFDWYWDPDEEEEAGTLWHRPQDDRPFYDEKYPAWPTPGKYFDPILPGSGPVPYEAAPNVRVETVNGGRRQPPSTGAGNYKNTGPLKNEKEKKLKLTLDPRSVLLRIFNNLSEVDDSVDAVWKALPKKIRKGQSRSLQNKIKMIVQNTDKIDYEMAIKNLYMETAKDFYYGQLGRAGKRAEQNLHRLGYSTGGYTTQTKTSATGAGRLPDFKFPAF